jgi:hypothetical protein
MFDVGQLPNGLAHYENISKKSVREKVRKTAQQIILDLNYS